MQFLRNVLVMFEMSDKASLLKKISKFARHGILPFFISFSTTSAILANPVNGQVVAGSATINSEGSNTYVVQTSDKAIINWDSFNIGPHEHTQFIQPSTNSIILNRANPRHGASYILGNLSANGQVWIINPAGILFGKDAQVNVAGLLATTANISNQNFMTGNYYFEQPAEWSRAVINEGTINVSDMGLVALVAPAVKNSGLIQANLGKVTLASGNVFTVDLYGDELVNFGIGAEIAKSGVDTMDVPLDDAVSNTGSIIANGGKVVLSARTVSSIVDNAINMQGYIEARSVAQSNGEIILSGGNQGRVKVTGKMDVSGKQVAQKGGKVTVTGKEIVVKDNAFIDASGDGDGGEILIGGDYQGKGSLPTAKVTYIGGEVVINADAISEGKGGKIIIWSDDNTTMHGKLYARGGINGGDGGLIETSGYLIDLRHAVVNAGSSHDKPGTWLVDPGDIVICKTSISCVHDAEAVIADDVINNALNSNTNFSVIADNSISMLPDASILLHAANENASPTLTLTSKKSQINLDSGSSITATRGKLNLTMNAFETIWLDAPIDLNGGTLTLNAGVGQTIANSAALNVGNFNLISGDWRQVTVTLPAFNVSHDFSIQPNASFMRFAGGEGIDISPYKVQDIFGLQGIGSSTTLLATSYELTGDIDASVTEHWNSGKGFLPIGDLFTRFSGSFNGNNFTINNLKINRPDTDNIGLFGYTFESLIENIGLNHAKIIGSRNVGALVGMLANSLLQTTYSRDGEVIGNDSRVGGLVGNSITNSAVMESHTTGNVSSASAGGVVGGLVGNNMGDIVNSYSTAEVAGANMVGGLIGITTGGQIINSYSAGKVTSQGTAGGLIGRSNSNSFILNTYSLSNVTGNDAVGGLIGFVEYSALINGSYSAGYVSGNSHVGGLIGQTSSISGIQNSFWNTETSGQVTSAAGIGKTTAQLMTANTFIDASWVFPDTWSIIPGVSYPYLKSIHAQPPQIVSGNLYTEPNAQLEGGNREIKMLVDGQHLASAYTGDNGFYYLQLENNTIPNMSNVLLYINDDIGSNQGNVIGSLTGAHLTGSDIYTGAVSIHGGNSTMANSQIVTATGLWSDNDILYSLAGNNITFNDSVSFNTSANTDYQLDGNLQASNAEIRFNGPVSLLSDTDIHITDGALVFNNTLNGNHNLILHTPGSNIKFDNHIGNIESLNELTIDDAADVISNSIIDPVQLVQANQIIINADNIAGSYHSNSLLLNGLTSINANVIADALILNGLNGGTINGIVGGVSDGNASSLVQLGLGATGNFTMNGCPIPGNCNSAMPVSPTAFETAATIIDQVGSSKLLPSPTVINEQNKFAELDTENPEMDNDLILIKLLNKEDKNLILNAGEITVNKTPTTFSDTI